MIVNGYDVKPFADLFGAYLSRANLSRADLSGADLSGADLFGADLFGAYLSRANLSRADLSGANLSRSDLSRANLSGANLSGADLSGADLSGANLFGADLSRANLSRAKIDDITATRLSILPDCGDVIGWKKCRGDVIVKLLIKDDTPRSNATGRKCRAERATVLEVIGAEFGISKYDPKFEYIVGSEVVCHEWDANRWNECGGGIHFFITRIEAENYE